jgi:hypothetical protein
MKKPDEYPVDADYAQKAIKKVNDALDARLKPKRKRQRKNMEMSVYNGLIKQVEHAKTMSSEYIEMKKLSMKQAEEIMELHIKLKTLNGLHDQALVTIDASRAKRLILQEENKVLIEENSRLKEGEQFWISTAQKEAADVRKHYDAVISQLNKENTHTSSLLSQCRHELTLLNNQIEIMNPIVKSHEKARNLAFVYQGLSIILAVSLVMLLIFLL